MSPASPCGVLVCTERFASTPACWRNRYMAENHAKLPYGPRVELGSGLGLCGIVIAMLDKDGAVGGKTSGGSRTAAVLCTDRSIALLEHVKENARLNHVEELVST